MPTSKQKRDAARRHLERQLQRRQQRESRRRQITLFSTVLGVLVVFAVVIVSVVMLSNDNSKSTNAAATSTPTSSATPSASPSASASATPNKISGTCAFTKDSTGTAAKTVSLPASKVPTKGTEVVKVATTQGNLTFTLNRAAAPCTVASFVSLVQQKYYDNTSCHRLTTTGIYVLQCGDPTATGSGGPGYTIPDEYQGTESYGAGVLAMANTGQPHSGGSQFFIVWKDSTAALGKTYTVFGKVSAGMDVVDKVAKAGSDNSNGSGDGKPKLAIKITKATLS